MIFHRLRLINKSQSGFSFIELLIAATISGLITAAVTTAVFQVVVGNVRSNNHMTAVRQVQEAGYWVSHDSHMAQSMSTNIAAATGFPLTMSWVDFQGNRYESVYNLESMPNSGLKQFERYHVAYDADGNVTDNTTSVIARYIDDSGNPPQTSCNLTDSRLLFEVTATVGSVPQQEVETRIYEVIARPGL